MYRILFVCHGNICRSPMAEFIFKKLAQDAGLSSRFTVASAAVSDEEIVCGVGNPVYPPARRELLRHGIDPGDKRAAQLKKEDYDKWDLFAVMDDSNLRRAERIFGADPENKVRLLSSFTDGKEIADPWYTGDFGTAYRDIERGCKALLAAKAPQRNSPDGERN